MIRRCTFCRKLIWPWTQMRTSVVYNGEKHRGDTLYFHQDRCWIAYHSRQWNLRQAEKARL